MFCDFGMMYVWCNGEDMTQPIEKAEFLSTPIWTDKMFLVYRCLRELLCDAISVVLEVGSADPRESLPLFAKSCEIFVQCWRLCSCSHTIVIVVEYNVFWIHVLNFLWTARKILRELLRKMILKV